METTLLIRKSSGLVIGVGNTAASLALRLGETLILHLVFIDDRGSVVTLPAGSTGLLRTVPPADLAGTPRFAVNSWTTSGSGSTRKYTFTGTVWRNILATDLATVADILLSTQLEYVAAAQTYITDVIPTLISKTAFAGDTEVTLQPSDVALAWLRSQAVLFTDPTQTFSEEQAADVRDRLGITGTVEANTLRYVLNEDGLHVDLYNYAGTLVTRVLRVAL